MNTDRANSRSEHLVPLHEHGPAGGSCAGGCRGVTLLLGAGPGGPRSAPRPHPGAQPHAGRPWRGGRGAAANGPSPWVADGFSPIGWKQIRSCRNASSGTARKNLHQHLQRKTSGEPWLIFLPRPDKIPFLRLRVLRVHRHRGSGAPEVLRFPPLSTRGKFSPSERFATESLWTLPRSALLTLLTRGNQLQRAHTHIYIFKPSTQRTPFHSIAWIDTERLLVFSRFDSIN